MSGTVKSTMIRGSFGSKDEPVPVTIEIKGLSDDGSVHLIYINAPHDPQDFRHSFREAKKEFRVRVTQLLASIESEEFSKRALTEADE